MRIKWCVVDLIACGFVRGEVIARCINQKCPNADMVIKSDIMLSDFYKTNVAVFQRQSTGAMLDKMLTAKQMGIKVIYELDDNVFEIPVEFQKPYIYYCQPAVQACIKQFLANADAITVSTHKLALAIRGFCPGKPIFVIPNFIDAETWEPVFSQKQLDIPEYVTIGWMASGSHLIDAPLVAEALERLMAEFPALHLHFVGWIGFDNFKSLESFKDRIKVEPWIDIHALPYAMKDFDIGLCPLVEHPFNTSKSNLKWQQYAAMGVPSVVSPVPAYENVQHGKTGLIAEGNTPEAWYHHLKTLITDEKMRKTIGLTAHQEVLDKWDIRCNYGNWLDTFNQILK